MKLDKGGHKTMRIAEYVEEIRYEDLPGEVIEKTKMVILDTIGVMILDSPPRKIKNLVDPDKSG